MGVKHKNKKILKACVCVQAERERERKTRDKYIQMGQNVNG